MKDPCSKLRRYHVHFRGDRGSFPSYARACKWARLATIEHPGVMAKVTDAITGQLAAVYRDGIGR